MEDKQITQSVDNLVSDDANQSPDDAGLSLAANPLSQPISPTVPPIDNSTGTDNVISQQPAGDSLEEVLSDSKASKEDQPKDHHKSAEPKIKHHKDEHKSTHAKSDPALEPIKQKALSELEPIIDELELEPEEKFRTILMIIQASDSKDLIKKAYKAAEDIKDKKVRAKALLSVINEIDYFSTK